MTTADQQDPTEQPLTAGDEIRRREALIAGLRDLADFLEANPALPRAPFRASASIVALSVDEFDDTAAIVEGHPDIHSTGHQVERRHFGPVELTVQIDREKVLEDRERKLAEREAEASQAAA